MRVIQRLNNNVILVSNNDQKMIVTGKGIGFNVHPKDIVPSAKIEQKFILAEDINLEQFTALINNVPLEIVSFARDVIKVGEKALQKKLNANLIVALSDHINFAIQRVKEELMITHPLLWEIKQIYQAEYQFGLEVINMIKDKLQITLPQEEAAYIALHLVNAQMNVEKMNTTLESTAIINEIIQIVRYHFQLTLDENSFDFSRFVTHLRYFLHRQLKMPTIEEKGDEILVEIVCKKYPQATKCVEKIGYYLESTYGWQVSDNEKMYLTLHVNRIIEKKR